MYEAKIELEVTAGFEVNYQNKIKQEVDEASCGEVDCSIKTKQNINLGEPIGPVNILIYLTSISLDMFNETICSLDKLFKGKVKLVYSNTELKLKKFEES
ncbi:MAG: hypothetical protein RR470_08290 [Vagococcus sp.]|uniref:hypothetical protein n=1 Tax=Vagococcus sp. TaxID=1933889 RepID=UPI002FC8077B